MNLEQLAPASPFHHGEQQAQDRMGVREKLDKVGRIHIRDHMPEQHREFYGNLPFVLLGAVDEQGRPWASIFAGHPGFMSAPDSRHLEIAAQALHGNPLIGTLKPGAEVGLLGIELDSRRRNRLNGRIGSAGQEGISIETSQTFGNCPKYIQTREVEVQPGVDEPGTERPTTVTDHFDADTSGLSERV